MVTAKKLIASAKSLNQIVLSDIKNGLLWKYYNTKRSEPTFEETRKAGKRYTNCMGGVHFACTAAGIPASALRWYGAAGKIKWTNDDARRDAKRVFDFFTIKTKTVNYCLKKGIIQDGDIITYMNIVHTKMYLGTDHWYDTGHAYCNGSGEGAVFRKWIGEVKYGGRLVYDVIRLKGDHLYRVQVGAFNDKSKAQQRASRVRVKTGFDTFIEYTDMYRVYCGSFKDFNNAVKRIDDLAGKGVSKAFIKCME